MGEECIFCKIARGEIPSEKVFENEKVIAFNDINPKSPTHVLVVSKEHFTSLNEIPSDRMDIVTAIFNAARDIAKKAGVDENGYRIIVNTNRAAGQEVFHLHFHLMGGRQMGSMG